MNSKKLHYKQVTGDGLLNMRSRLEKINPHAAGIDIGSREHYVCIPGEEEKQIVRVFGCYTPDLMELSNWLISHGIKTVAMESTGVYWIPVFEILQQSGLHVILVDAKHVKNVPGRKTDVKDCQWIQQLHSYGLLSSCFLPDQQTSVLRSYWRQRDLLVKQCSKQIHHMQKALEQLNIQLHKAISDITGVSGMAIIQAIVNGETDPNKLALLRHQSVKKSDEEMVKALTGNFRKEHIFSLKQALELYEILQSKIKDCDAEIEVYLNTLESKGEVKISSTSKLPKRRKNQSHFDLKAELARVSGVDLCSISGLQALTVSTILSEIGFSLDAFSTEKHFASWLCLCPNKKITGGKVKSSRTKKSKNRATTAFRLAAFSVAKSKCYLGAFYRRMAARLGPPKAITATAHKIAIIFYRMLKQGEQYVEKGQDTYKKQFEAQQLKYMERRAKEMGFTLVPSNA